MLKLLMILSLVGVAGCAMRPLTPEEQMRYRAAGQALQGYGQQMQQQQRGPSQQNCTVRDMGNGYYQQQCQPVY